MADKKISPADTPPPDGATPTAGENYRPLDIVEELRESYLNYAMSVIVSRALPDVRDGLKPSQRRILVAMHDLGLNPTAGTSKCAGIVGETMKRYHPHGDQAIYPTLVRMAQDWNMRYRLIHPQGNFGSNAGLPAAAMRYTEARLSPIAGEMLADVECDTVDFGDNFDGRFREPLVLPSKFPNLLVNGADGIAVGMATEIPPHNLREVCEALIRLLDDPDLSVAELLQIIPGPDYPTGGIICGRQGIIEGYTTGRGKVILRARADVDEKKRQIIIREIPYQQTRNRIMEVIGKLVKEERIKHVGEIRDESSAREGEPVKIVLDIKRDGDPHAILRQLYELAPIQVTASIILLALVDGRPRTLTLKQLLEEFIRHRIQVVRRRTEFRLREAKKRTHVLEGQLIAVSSMDEVIRIIRGSPSRSEAKVRLQDMQVAATLLERALGSAHFAALQAEIGVAPAYSMTEAQAEAVVRMQLGQLTALERDEIFKEYDDLRAKIVSYETLLSSDANVRAVIKVELQDLRDKYGDDRRTEFGEEQGRLNIEEWIPEETNIVTLSHEGYLKRLSVSTFKAQHRGGRGVTGASTRENDWTEHFFVTSSHAYLLCFTNLGQCYWLRAFNIPMTPNRTSPGRHINQVLQLKPDERITSVIPVQKFDQERDSNRCLVMATRRGLVKKTPLLEYSNVRTGGIIGIALEEGDTLLKVVLTKPGDELVLCTRNGLAIRFDESEVRTVGRKAYGVKGISLGLDDEVVGMVVADPSGYLLSVCENGYGKRTPFGANIAGEVNEESEPAEAEAADSVEEASTEEETPATSSKMRYRKQRRGGKGLLDIRTDSRNGKVVSVAAVRDDHDVMMVSVNGMVTRTHASEIRVVGRGSKGVKVINLQEGDKLALVACVDREEQVVQTAEAETIRQPASTSHQPHPSPPIAEDSESHS